MLQPCDRALQQLDGGGAWRQGGGRAVARARSNAWTWPAHSCQPDACASCPPLHGRPAAGRRRLAAAAVPPLVQRGRHQLPKGGGLDVPLLPQLIQVVLQREPLVTAYQATHGRVAAVGCTGATAHDPPAKPSVRHKGRRAGATKGKARPICRRRHLQCATTHSVCASVPSPARPIKSWSCTL